MAPSCQLGATPKGHPAAELQWAWWRTALRQHPLVPLPDAASFLLLPQVLSPRAPLIHICQRISISGSAFRDLTCFLDDSQFVLQETGADSKL